MSDYVLYVYCRRNGVSRDAEEQNRITTDDESEAMRLFQKDIAWLHRFYDEVGVTIYKDGKELKPAAYRRERKSKMSDEIDIHDMGVAGTYLLEAELEKMRQHAERVETDAATLRAALKALSDAWRDKPLSYSNADEDSARKEAFDSCADDIDGLLATK